MGELKRPVPLGPNHNVDQFDCGREALNLWLRRNARRNESGNVSRTTVITDTDNKTIAAFMSLSVSEIQREFLPKADQRNRPSLLPMVLLGQLAVDLRYQRRGCAASLMLSMARTCMALSRDVGCFGIMTHPLDEDVRAFYRSFGFVDTPFDPRRSMIMRVADLVASDNGEDA